ncbi:hypothetical protein BDZ91DRAFT_553762 [Kalaharituber pfeilii]|nr:hypothetical protein BDZ91DRAFT_553762 [Kalaharituber pfeilii]
MVKRQRRQSEGLAGVPDSLARSKKPRGNAAIDHATAKARPSHLVLSAYFSTLVTLRQYFITRLSGLQRTAAQDRGLDELRSDRTRRASEPLCKLLDTALVGLSNGIPQADPVAQDILEATACSPTWSSGEIVELAIRLLFSRSKAHGPLNVLTGGFSRRAGEIVSNFPNSHVNTLKTSVVWKQLLKIVRQEVMLDLLLNTSVFISVENDCYYQLIGKYLRSFQGEILGSY